MLLLRLLVGGGPVKDDPHTTDIVLKSFTHNADGNALYVTASLYVAESRCCINTPELTNRCGHCTSMFPVPQIVIVDQMQPFQCRIAHLWSPINHGLTLTYSKLPTGNCLAALRTGRIFGEGVCITAE
jgi:hypothetical protein